MSDLEWVLIPLVVFGITEIFKIIGSGQHKRDVQDWYNDMNAVSDADPDLAVAHECPKCGAIRTSTPCEYCGTLTQE